MRKACCSPRASARARLAMPTPCPARCAAASSSASCTAGSSWPLCLRTRSFALLNGTPDADGVALRHSVTFTSDAALAAAAPYSSCERERDARACVSTSHRKIAARRKAEPCKQACLREARRAAAGRLALRRGRELRGRRGGGGGGLAAAAALREAVVRCAHFALRARLQVRHLRILQIGAVCDTRVHACALTSGNSSASSMPSDAAPRSNAPMPPLAPLLGTGAGAGVGG